MGKRRKKNIYSGPNITEKHNFQLDQSLKLSIVEYDEMGVGKAFFKDTPVIVFNSIIGCLLYTSPSPRDRTRSRMPSSA